MRLVARPRAGEREVRRRAGSHCLGGRDQRRSYRRDRSGCEGDWAVHADDQPQRAHGYSRPYRLERALQAGWHETRWIETAFSIAELQQVIADRAKTVPEGPDRFITAMGGWSQSQF